MDCSLPGSSVHGISQARILEWVSMSFSRGSFQTRDWTCISCTGRQILFHWATEEAHLGSAMCLILLFTIIRQALGFVLGLFPPWSHQCVAWLCLGEQKPSKQKWVRFTFLCSSSVQFSSVAQLYPTLYDPMKCSS